jgi:vitamin B12 transporter
MKYLILAALLPTAVFAQTKIPEVTIYGSSHVPVELPKVGSSVSLITAEEIETRGIKLLSEALATLPGLRVNGNAGGLSQMRLRGSEGKHTLLIVDGVVYNDVNQGEATLDQFPVNDIERIELIRGPQSGVYGAQAHAGAIVITTKSGKGFRKPEVNATFELGSQGSQLVSLSVQGQVGKVYSATSIQANRTDGYNFAFIGTEKDGLNNFNITQKLGIDINEQFNVEGFIRHQQKGQRYDRSQFITGLTSLEDGDNRSDTKNTLASLKATYKALEGRWVHTLSADLNSLDARNFSNNLPDFSNQGNRYTLTYKNAFRFEAGGFKHTLVSGFDMKRETYKYQDTYNSEYIDGVARSRRGIFGEYLLDFNQGTSVTAAVRQDFNSVFQDIFTYRLAAAHTFATGTKLHGSFGKGSTNPTFQQQYGYQPSNFVGNPNIKPESSFGYDFGVEQKWLGGRLITDLTYYNIALRDAITPFYNNFFQESVLNAPGTLHRHGVEFAFTAIPTDKLSISGSYTYFTGKDALGLLPVRRPNHAASLNASYRLLDDKARLAVGLSHNGKMRDNVFNNNTYVNDSLTLREFTLLSAQFSYDVNKNTTAYVRAENMLNTRYEEVYSYRGKPIEVYAGLKVKFQ